MSNAEICKRELPGLKVTPALRELNEIREHTDHDMSVYDRDTFHKLTRTLTNGTFSNKEIDDAYDQLHLIMELGGSEQPMYELIHLLLHKERT